MPRQGAPLGLVNVLLVEDSPEDAELMCDQMVEAGLEASFRRVDSDADLRAALQESPPDIVLSDLSMPGFSGYEALRIVQEMVPGTPFIFVSGTMGEETAVEALHQGANDYIIKHQPARLPSAVARAIREGRVERERRQVENELMRAQRLESLALLAAGLSHDLRNILQPLLIVPELIKSRSDDPQMARLADVITECGRRGHEMAESMLSFVRGSSRPAEKIEIRRLFQALEMLLKSNMPANVRLEIELSDESLAVEANYTELQQALLNLALNAIQAMPDGGRLLLAASQAEGVDGSRVLCIRIADEGVGMDPATLSRLFSPFFTTKPGGTGLGLVSCKRIIESCSGSIHVDSRPGEGTRFDLVLPMHGKGKGKEAEPAPSVPLGKGQSLLVVDSEATRLSLLGNALSSQGYELHLAADGAQALRYVQDGHMPDLLIVDSGIPLMSASQLLEEMVASGYRGPAVVLEDAAAPLNGARFPRETKVHVLRKPLEMQRAFQMVAEALARG